MKKISLQWKISLYFFIVITIVGIVTGVVVYHSSEDLALSSFKQRGVNRANAIQKEININDFLKLKEKAKEVTDGKLDAKEVASSPAFLAMNKALNDYRVSNGVKYVYTMTKYNKENFIYVVDGYTLEPTLGDGVHDKGISPPGKKEKTLDGELKMYNSGEVYASDMVYTKDWGALLSTYAPLKDQNGQVVGLVGVDLDGNMIYQQLQKTKYIIILIIVLGSLLTMAASLFYARMLTKMLRNAKEKIEAVGKGDLTTQIETTRTDEIGEVIHHFSNTIKELNHMIRVINDTTNELGQTNQSLIKESKNISSNVENTVFKTKKIKEVIDKQMENVQLVVKLVNKMNQTFKEIAKNTNDVNNSSGKVSDSASKGKEQMESVINRMNIMQEFQIDYVEMAKELQKKTQKIDEIVTTISGIANQTNLLSLNASIEAARAGEHGKGFAVVANEVKKLAEQSSKSVQDISKLVEMISDSMEKTVGHITKATESVRTSTTEVMESGKLFMNIINDIQGVNGQIKEINKETVQLLDDNDQTLRSIETVEKLSKETYQTLENFEETINEQEKSLKKYEKETNQLTNITERLTDLVKKFKI